MFKPVQVCYVTLSRLFTSQSRITSIRDVSLKCLSRIKWKNFTIFSVFSPFSRDFYLSHFDFEFISDDDHQLCDIIYFWANDLSRSLRVNSHINNNTWLLPALKATKKYDCTQYLAKIWRQHALKTPVQRKQLLLSLRSVKCFVSST